MYVPADATRLRQGDVIKGLFLPRYSVEAGLLHRSTYDGTLDFQGRAVVAAESRLAVVVSQCCEFNPGKRQAFSVAALTPLRGALRTPILPWGVNVAELVALARSAYRGSGSMEGTADRLRRANHIDVDAPTTNEALNVYLYDPDGAQLLEPHVVDFSWVTSIRIQDLPTVRRLKLLELDDDHRREFQLKLAYFYGRTAEP